MCRRSSRRTTRTRKRRSRTCARSSTGSVKAPVRGQRGVAGVSIEKKSATEIRSSFEAFNVEKGASLKTAVALKEAEFHLAGPHVVRLPKGSAPYRESLTAFQLTARRIVG